MPLETPAMENLSVLTGKYGDEGDKLIFKILNSGDFLNKTTETDYQNGSKAILSKISEKALRYDLTVPFARYVVMNRNDIAFPFKRYQIQPVWRADNPQKGRYREFYQCDADVVGTDSLICEAEIVLMLKEVFHKLGLQSYSIKINNRKILKGITEIIGKEGCETDFCVAIDKLDKIGLTGVVSELKEKGFSEEEIKQLDPVLSISGDNNSKLLKLESVIKSSSEGMNGIREIREVFKFIESFGSTTEHVEFDLTLARGLTYYTGAIFEVKAIGVQIGSISGGGRYDNLTGVFGMPGVSGVGISFGVDRIYDVLDELKLFPEDKITTTKVLFCCFDGRTQEFALPIIQRLRSEGINCEIYPDLVKIKKQLEYANKKGISYVALIGDEEMQSGSVMLKDMISGEQQKVSVENLLKKLSQN